MRWIIRPFGRQRKLLKVLAPAALLVVLYVISSKRLHVKEPVRCVNGICAVGDEVHREARRNFDVVDEYKTAAFDNSTVITKAIHPDIVIYNRVPKCASSTFRYLISRLRVFNKFRYEIHNWPNVKQRLNPAEEEDLVRKVTSLPHPLLFLRHLHFVDFQKHNVTKPAYINVIRDPVDRFVSHYYFSRFGFVNWTEQKIEKWLWPMPEERRNLDLDECVRLGAEQCVRDNKENMLEFFCGQDERCRKHDDWALDRAKDNIAQNYVFIGILEQFEDSLKVAETILPRYFSGVTDAYLNRPHSGSHTKTARKKEPSEQTRAALEQALRHEMDLYHYVKRRFEFQLDSLRQSGKIT